jgi:quinohemoprotein ethanol dehydrogenase
MRVHFSEGEACDTSRSAPIRGYVTAYDAQSGKQLWRFYAVPGDPAKGFESKAMEMAAKTWTGEWWKKSGGGTMWNAITYDRPCRALLTSTRLLRS